MALTIDIKTSDDFEKAALRTAEALKQIATHEEKVAKIAERLGKPQKDVAKALQHVAQVEKDREKKEGEAQKARLSKEGEFRDKLKASAAGLYLIKNAAMAAKDVAVDLGKSLLEAAFDASQTKRDAEAMIGAFTGGDGPRTMKLLDELAGKLGVSVSDVRSEFVEFRKAGMDNQMSAKLIKLRADLMATGLSAGSADAAISKITAAGHNRGLASNYYEQTAKAFGVMGDGAKAAAYNTTSLAGAQAKLQNLAEEKLADLWGRIGPAIGKAANELVDFATKFANSKEGGEIIKGIGDAFVSIASNVKPAAQGIGKFLEFISEDKVAIVSGLAVAATALGIALAPAAIAAVAAAAAAAALPVAIAAAAVGVGLAVHQIVKHWDEIKELASSVYDWGANIVTGLVDGITSKIGAVVDIAKSMAKSVAGPFASVLGIRSPSTLFAEYGKHTVSGFERGQEKAMGGELPLQAAASSAPGGGMGGGGGGVVIQNLVVHGYGGKADDLARSIRQEIQLLLQAGAMSRGIA